MGNYGIFRLWVMQDLYHQVTAPKTRTTTLRLSHIPGLSQGSMGPLQLVA